MSLGIDKRVIPGFSHLEAITKYALYDMPATQLSSSVSIPFSESRQATSLPFFNGIRSKDNVVVSDSTWSMSSMGSVEDQEWNWYSGMESQSCGIHNHSDMVNRDDELPNFDSPSDFGTNIEILSQFDQPTFLPSSIIRPGASDDLPISSDTSTIFRFRQWQCHAQVASNFISRHIFITSNTRSAIVSWMKRTAHLLALRPETLFLAVSLSDRYLGVTLKMETIESYRRIAIAAIHTASKYEENRTPGLNRLIQSADVKYTPENIVETEISLLATLNFRIGGPTILTILMSCLDALEPSPGPRIVAMCYEVAQSLLLDEAVASEHMPCDIARATIAAVCRLFDPDAYELFWYRQLRSWGKDAPLLRAHSLVSTAVWIADRQKKDSTFIDYLACLVPNYTRPELQPPHEVYNEDFEISWADIQQKMSVFS